MQGSVSALQVMVGGRGRGSVLEEDEEPSTDAKSEVVAIELEISAQMMV